MRVGILVLRTIIIIIVILIIIAFFTRRTLKEFSIFEHKNIYNENR
ncbi:MAG: hypothetical protein ACUVWP_04940 [bacterium]